MQHQHFRRTLYWLINTGQKEDDEKDLCINRQVRSGALIWRGLDQLSQHSGGFRGGRAGSAPPPWATD